MKRRKEKKDVATMYRDRELYVVKANLEAWNYWGRTWRHSRQDHSPNRRITRMIKIRALTYQKAYLEMVKSFHGLKNKNVVDIGCGASEYLKWLVNDCNILVGVDISIEMLKLCREDLGKSIELVAADALNLPFRDEAFDISTTFQALHHFPNIDNALKEMVRISKNISIYEPNSDSFFHRFLHLIRKSLRVEQRFKQTDKNYSLIEFHAKGFSQKTLSELLKKKGMNTKIFMFGILPVSLLEFFSRFLLLNFIFKAEDLLRKIPVIQNQLGGILLIAWKQSI